ncbi:hypothetical protein AERO8C_120044 [Aeromonas veronii]|uniref:Uncharacterized protein n=1 Tax=Aeromonas veronii TaxID=654 RepID=A0A653KQ41_AERVE|nr:hypothetical protein AERO8C_120044 [Aeromonas veronii]
MKNGQPRLTVFFFAVTGESTPSVGSACSDGTLDGQRVDRVGDAIGLGSLVDFLLLVIASPQILGAVERLLTTIGLLVTLRAGLVGLLEAGFHAAALDVEAALARIGKVHRGDGRGGGRQQGATGERQCAQQNEMF